MSTLTKEKLWDTLKSPPVKSKTCENCEHGTKFNRNYLCAINVNMKCYVSPDQFWEWDGING